MRYELRKPFTIIVVAGEIELKDKREARQWSGVTKIILHPKYDHQKVYNDIALLQVSTTEFTYLTL